MSSINRATLPQAFLTEVNAGLLLPQPEPHTRTTAAHQHADTARSRGGHVGTPGHEGT